jgi:DNA-directed RNA polymerase specialized sigma24 family protein
MNWACSAITSGPGDDEAVAALTCLRTLPAEQREILMLAGWEGLSAGEIGRVLGCSPTAARIRLHRARAKLRAEVQAAPGSPKQKAATRHVEDRGAKFGCAPEEGKG